MENDPSKIVISTRSLALDAWKQCWNEFFEWEQEYSSKQLASLQQPLPPLIIRHPQEELASNEVDILTVDDEDDGPDDEAADDFHEDTEQSEMKVWYFDNDNPSDNSGASSSKKAAVTLSAPVYTVNPLLPPLPPYESAAPLLQSITLANTPADQGLLKFYPDADQDEFEEGNYEDLDPVWKDLYPGRRDPDVDMVEYETARRLCQDYGFTLEEIDATGVLPNRLLVEALGGQKVVNNVYKKRTFLPWPPRDPSSQENPDWLDQLERQLMDARSEADHQLVQSMHFCPNLNCIEISCSTHRGVRPTWPGRLPQRTQTLSESVVLDGKVCSWECYQNMERLPGDTAFVWTKSECRDLREIWEISDGLTVCEVAVMVMKPCWQTFLQLHTLPDEKNTRQLDDAPGQEHSDSEGGASSDYSLRKFLSTVRSDDRTFEYAGPCSHSGPCGKRSDCICYERNLFCERNCNCDRSCIRRFKGCQCEPRGGRSMTCQTKKCLCWQNQRECDPELCLSCRAKEGHPCRNANMLFGKSKKTEVIHKNYEWGYAYGLRLLQEAKTSDFVMEYTGEIIVADEIEQRVPHNELVHRSYIFNLDFKRSIDGARASNEVKFINHGEERFRKRHQLTEGDANLRAATFFVNGDPRIGLFATRRIKSGEELFFNYGDEFFTKEDVSKGGAEMEDNMESPVEEEEEIPEYDHDNLENDATYHDSADESYSSSD